MFRLTKNRFIWISFLILIVSIKSGAQNMNEEFRKKPPEPLKEIPFSIGKPIETTLKNGLRIVIFENNRLPIVNYRLCFKVGDVNDPPDQIGLTAALTHMLSQGTTKRTSKQFAEEVESLGASISASSSHDNLIISSASLNIYSDKILDLISDMVLNPVFPENELNLYKQNTIEELKFQRSQPSFLADEQVARIIYGKHPYSIISPKASDIEKLTRDKLIDWRKKILIPNNAIFIIVGDVNPKAIIDKMEGLFGNWQTGETPKKDFESPPVRNEKTLTIVDRKGSAQSNIVISNLAIPRNHPDYFPVIVMNQILGAGASSRLFLNLRESKGYTYGAYSNFDMKRLAGNFEASAEVRTQVTADALKEFFYELNRIRDSKVPEEELKDAKNFLTGVFPIRLETQEGLTNLITQQQLFDLPSDYLQTYSEKVNAVTADDVQRVAQKYILPDKAAIVIVGDAEEILDKVKAYASKIEIFDTEGNPQNISNYAKSDEKPAINVSGKWELTIDASMMGAPNQNLTLLLEQKDNLVTGTVDSALGKAQIQNGKVRGNRLSATVVFSVPGQNMQIEAKVNAEVKENQMKGSISLTQMSLTLPFSGKRVN
ncbi:MAG: insulinase family protein [Acidobacteria bacterium]|nr:MAG: insulinase family protein [Acidobacteriota bacterium]